MSTITTTFGPRPLFVVHHVAPGRIGADCGAFPGARRADLGTFVQDTGHHTLTAEQPVGFVACPACLALLAEAVAA